MTLCCCLILLLSLFRIFYVFTLYLPVTFLSLFLCPFCFFIISFVYLLYLDVSSLSFPPQCLFSTTFQFSHQFTNRLILILFYLYCLSFCFLCIFFFSLLRLCYRFLQWKSINQVFLYLYYLLLNASFLSHIPLFLISLSCVIYVHFLFPLVSFTFQSCILLYLLFFASSCHLFVSIILFFLIGWICYRFFCLFNASFSSCLMTSQ